MVQGGTLLDPTLSVVSGGLATTPHFCTLSHRDIDELAAMSDEQRLLDPRSAHVKRCNVCQDELCEQLAMKAARSTEAV